MKYTQQTVALFQSQEGLVVDGVLGEKTLAAVRAKKFDSFEEWLEGDGPTLDDEGNPDWSFRGGRNKDREIGVRGVSGAFVPKGVMIHHTAGPVGRERVNDEVLEEGRPNLRGPLVQVGIDRDGTACWVTNGRAHHAGGGCGRVLEALLQDLAKRPNPGPDNTYGNTHFLGIELENSGQAGDAYPEEQIDRAVEITVMWCKAFRWTANKVLGHKEWTRRKVDPSLDMGMFRAKAAQKLLSRQAPVASEGEGGVTYADFFAESERLSRATEHVANVHHALYAKVSNLQLELAALQKAFADQEAWLLKKLSAVSEAPVSAQKDDSSKSFGWATPGMRVRYQYEGHTWAGAVSDLVINEEGKVVGCYVLPDNDNRTQLFGSLSFLSRETP